MSQPSLFSTAARRELLAGMLLVLAGIGVMAVGNYTTWAAFSGFGGGLIFVGFWIWLLGALRRKGGVLE